MSSSRSIAHSRRSGQTVSEKGEEKEEKAVCGDEAEKILINKQEVAATASKEGSIIDIGTRAVLSAPERGKRT